MGGGRGGIIITEYKKSRSRTEIIHDILQCARNDGNGAGKTQIMRTASISYFQMKDYLTTMTHKELLYYDMGTHKFRITEKGLSCLKLCEQIVGLIVEEEEEEPYDDDTDWSKV